MGKMKAEPSNTPSAGTGALRLVIGEKLRLRGDGGGRRQAEMNIGLRRQHPPARRALHEALLDEIGLDDLLDRVARLAERGGDGLDPDGAAGIALGNERKIPPVEGIESALVHFQSRKRSIRNDLINLDATRNRRKIAHAL